MTMPPAPYPPPPSSQRNKSSNADSNSTNNSSNRVYYSEEQRYAAQYKRPGTRVGLAGSSNISTTSSATNDGGLRHSNKQQQKLPARVAFVPNSPFSDLYGAINCDGQQKEGISCGDGKDKKLLGGNSSVSTRIKYGPTLLEIRRMTYSASYHDTTASCEEGDDRQINQLDETNEEKNDDDGESLLTAAAATSEKSQPSSTQSQSFINNSITVHLGLVKQVY